MALSNEDLKRMQPQDGGDQLQTQQAQERVADEKGEDRQPGETAIWTTFTQAGGTKLLYSANTWVTVRVTLTTAGPVVVGNKQSLDPVLSGQGMLLVTDETMVFSLGSGSRLYYAADAVNRLSVVVEPVPWLRKISETLAGASKSLSILPKLFTGRVPRC